MTQVYSDLLEACMSNNISDVNGILHSYPHLINHTDIYQVTPLHCAAQNGHQDLVRLLLSMGADVKIVNNYKRTALHLACEHDCIEIAKILIEAGSDPYAKDYEGRSAENMISSALRRHLRTYIMRFQREEHEVNPSSMSPVTSARKPLKGPKHLDADNAVDDMWSTSSRSSYRPPQLQPSRTRTKRSPSFILESMRSGHGEEVNVNNASPQELQEELTTLRGCIKMLFNQLDGANEQISELTQQLDANRHPSHQPVHRYSNQQSTNRFY
ncbi:hypothetical protein PCE1_002920 [Barthelona sp. PCE]